MEIESQTADDGIIVRNMQLEDEVRHSLDTIPNYPLFEPDAMKWAVAWRLIRDKNGIDANAGQEKDIDGWMVGWFANAMASADPKMLISRNVPKPTADDQYRDIVLDILRNGDRKGDRTGVGTLATWGQTARFDLSDGSFPIITTKRVFWKTAIKEMILFLKGATQLREFLLQNVKIWTDWPLANYRKETGVDISQEEFEKCILEDDAFSDAWGDLGPIYGKQWRNWVGADGKSYDQITDVVNTLRDNPNSRRIIIEGWKVDELEGMALPPCHKTYQFQVTSDGRLNSFMLQRKH